MDDTVNNQFDQSVHVDALLECLVILSRIHDCTVSPEALKAGLPLVNHQLTPSLFVRAAQRANLSARIVKRELIDIPELVLPAVLLLKNNQACILQSKQNGLFTVISPEAGQGQVERSLDELTEVYSGYTIFVQPEHQFEQRANDYAVKKPKSWFWGTLFKFRRNYYRVALAALLINFFALVSPLFVMNVYDRVVPNNAFETLWVLAIGVGIAFLFDFLLKNIRSYLIDISGKKADTLMSSMIFNRAVNIRMECKPASAGAFANNLQGFEAVRDFFTSATLASLIDLPFIFLFVWVIWMLAGSLAIVPLIAIPLIILVSILLEVPIRSAVCEGFVGSTQKQAILVETLYSLETIKTLGAESERQRKWEHFVAITARAGMKSRLFSSLVVNFSAYVLQMVTVCVVVYGVYLISDGLLSMGGLIACVILGGRALAPLTQVATLITRYQQSKLGLQAINKVMQMPQERCDDVRYIHRPKQNGSLEFKGVTFCYPQQSMKALDNCSLKLTAGEKVAIIGRIGSGKSTLLKLLLQLYLPQEGSVLLAGTDICQIDPSDVRHNISAVSQQDSLFYGTLRENIIKACPWADDAALLRAAQLAGVSAFAQEHPKGFDMMIGEGGFGLSGGQRQAVLIARALLKDAPILLLDEPTNAMDSVAEKAFGDSLQQIMKDKTVLLVTHKKSLLNLVDRIIVMDRGQVIADDTREKINTKLQSTFKHTSTEQ